MAVIKLSMLKIWGDYMHEIEARKNGTVYCVYTSESCLPDKDTLKAMKAAGYKLYQYGKLYKPQSK